MISVLATIKIKPGTREQFIAAFKRLMPAVHAEDGCIEYFPAVDISTDIPVQQCDPLAITVIEKWSSLAALKLHLEAPHMHSYREETAGWVESVTLKVLEEA